MSRIHWIRPEDPPDSFPAPETALREPNGLLAAGGDLSTERLLAAYRRGIFPWYERSEPVLWWSPDPRCVFVPGEVHVSRRLARLLRQERFEVRLDTAFTAVLDGCAGPRAYGDGTWITRAMHAAYQRLHALGHAHSIEAWRDGELAGGLYGVAIGEVFFGESMFSAERDASKVVLAHLSRWLEIHGFALIDCQVRSAHLVRMGAVMLPRREFLDVLEARCTARVSEDVWTSGFTI